MRLLVLNAGSSSLKASVLEGTTVVDKHDLPAHGGVVDEAGLRTIVDAAGEVDAIGHRIVHGGTDFTGPTLIDEAVRRRLGELSDLAPLHQAKSLAVLDQVSEALPDVTAVACFDTAFHATLAAAAATYALPAEWRERWPLRRFGFHGLSHAYCSRRAAEVVGRPLADLRVVTCHLGSGASLAAVRGGVSVDTTMGFTPLEGLVMSTRSGSVDPGLVLWLEEHAGIAPAELARTLEQRSGLLGLAGTADLREVLAAEAAGDEAAALAVGVYLHRLRGEIARMAAAMDGIDVVVFTGGVGENSAPIRARAADGLSFLGVAVDADLNGDAAADRAISPAGAAVTTLVIEAREDLEIAREVHQLLGPGRRGISLA